MKKTESCLFVLGCQYTFSQAVIGFNQNISGLVITQEAFLFKAELYRKVYGRNLCRNLVQMILNMPGVILAYPTKDGALQRENVTYEKKKVCIRFQDTPYRGIKT